jgi:hypothetical protein
MIIILDKSLVSGLCPESEERDQILAALSISAQQAWEGNHMIIGDRDTFLAIAQYYSEMDLRTRAALRRASDKLTGRKQIRDFAKRAIRIVSSEVTKIPLRKDVSDDKQEIWVPALTIERHSSIIGKAVLLVENISDGQVYIKLARSLAKSKLLPDMHWLGKVPLSYEIMPGGGNTLCDLFALRCSVGDRIGLALADSDYRYPGSDLGDTAQRLLATAERMEESPLLEVLTLAVRAIENCIPAAEVRSIMGELDPVQLQRFNQLHERFYGGDNWRFIPVKSGIRCFELSQCSAESQYWTSLLGGRVCAELEACESKRRCGTFVVEPISDRLLAKVAQRESDLLMTESCASGLKDEWERLSIFLYAYFCGETRELGK